MAALIGCIRHRSLSESVIALPELLKLVKNLYKGCNLSL